MNEKQVVYIKVNERMSVSLEVPEEVDLEDLKKDIDKISQLKGETKEVVKLKDGRKRPLTEAHKRAIGNANRKRWAELKSDKKNQKWTEDEDSFLRAKRDTHTSKELSEMLGRTHDSVKTRLQQIGVKKSGWGSGVKIKKPNRRGHNWSDSEVKYLLKNAGQKPMRKIAKHLGLKPKQCHDKYYLLKKVYRK